MLAPALLTALVLVAPPPPDPLAPVEFLLGEWAGEGGGKPGQATSATSTFRRDLGGRVAVRRSRSEYAPRAGEAAGAAHEDLLVVHPSAGGLRAVYFDDEGHVIEYAVTAEPGRATFESVPAGPGPRFRLAYARRADGDVDVTFSIAPPGKPFETYVSGRMRRR